jgi:glycerol-1-phosphatase
VMVCGGPGIIEALDARNGVAAQEPPFDVVMVGFHRTFDYEEMRVAAAAVRGGARLIATNNDATYPTPEGPIPGGGSIVAGIAVASGVKPAVAGKPFEPMANLARAVLGRDDVSDAVMIGDRPDTDGLFAHTLGCRYAHVWSGVTPPGSVVTPTPWLEGKNLAAVVDVLLGTAAPQRDYA